MTDNSTSSHIFNPTSQVACKEHMSQTNSANWYAVGVTCLIQLIVLKTFYIRARLKIIK